MPGGTVARDRFALPMAVGAVERVGPKASSMGPSIAATASSSVRPDSMFRRWASG